MLKILLILSVVDFFAFDLYNGASDLGRLLLLSGYRHRSKLKNAVSLKKEKTNIVILQHTYILEVLNRENINIDQAVREKG